MRSLHVGLFVAAALALAIGCGGEKKSGGAPGKKKTATMEAARADEGGGLIRKVTGGPAPEPAPPPGDFPKALLTRLDQAGLKHEGWAAAPGAAYGASTCSRGLVERLDVLLCAFGTEAAATAAEEKLLEFVTDAVTVVARRAGTSVVAVADRQKVDLRGQQITRVLKALGAVTEPDATPPPPPPP